MLNKAKVFIENTKIKLKELNDRAAAAMADKRGGQYIDQAMLIVIAVVIGCVILVGLYYLFDDIVMPLLGNKITNLFS